MKIVIIGGGAAGFFAAINCAENNRKAEVIILERGKSVLGKVKISGGGRCNVTHACFVPRDLVKNYPRGSKELLSPFSRFCTGDTIEWFEKHGVELKIEADNRMFPVTNDSQTIVDCLWETAKKLGVKVLTQHQLEGIEAPKSTAKYWTIRVRNKENIVADKVMLATGSNPRIWKMLKKLGHDIVEPVPSLFTFNINDERIKGLAGLSVPKATIEVLGTKLKSEGALLITHWGLSAPAVLKLSAWGARKLNELNYQFTIRVNWLAGANIDLVLEDLQYFKEENPKKMVFSNTMFDLPNRLWKKIVQGANIKEKQQWANISKKSLQSLARELTQAKFEVNGKSTFKEEFVTAGGVNLKNVNFKNFESKVHENLFFAGEVLNIDGVTGGFNFQAAWTGGYIVGHSMADK